MSIGLDKLFLLDKSRTRSISAENPTGEKGKGGMALPTEDTEYPNSSAALELGQGWKARPFLKPKAGETLTIMDIDGPGVIQHIWMTSDMSFKKAGRSCVLRFYWDNEETPSVEVPMSDFFAVGHDEFAPMNSAVVIVNPLTALNCYWQMPFRKHARITFTNELNTDLELLAFQITYAETEVPEDAAYSHAQWRRGVTEKSHPEFTILDGVQGKGKYVGTFLAWTQLSAGWFGEGEIKFFMDGDKQFPTICGTGVEDYFCGSWGFPETYSTLYAGNTLRLKGLDDPQKFSPPQWSLYRWHIMDPICFEEELRVTIQSLGWGQDGKYRPLEDDIASTAYWYQTEPHQKFPDFPSYKERWPR
ncbi:glycoside hydrolase family 172 protein [Paenibacillus psychroresistens]|nr:glycoside hydrolase family 172 protein [Paenibacillus psychroresistens]